MITLIPHSWEKYRQIQDSISSSITINLEEDKTELITDDTDNWLIREKHGFPMVVYIRHGKALFGLINSDSHVVTVVVWKAIDSYIRIGIHYGLMLALYQECVGLHGVTLLCGNEIIILSAPSGTGKTTLAKLLEKHCGAIVINGDFALLNPTVDGVIFVPTPFCGSSSRSLNHRFQVSRIVFLGQAKENVWQELSSRNAMVRFMSNAFVPTWDSIMQQTVQENILKCISMLKVDEYDFAPTQEAAEVFLRQVENDSLLCLERHPEKKDST